MVHFVSEMVYELIQATNEYSQDHRTKYMAQMMERLLANINANQEKADADRKADREEMTANNKTMLAKMDANTKIMQENQAKMEGDRKADKEQILVEMKANQEMTTRMDIRHKEMLAWLKDLKFNREETMACKETLEARLGIEEPASVDMAPEVAHEEVPVKDAVFMPVAEPRKRRRDRRNLAAVRRRTKTWTQGVAGRNRNGPTGKMGADRIWSLPAEGRHVLRKWHDATFY
jgi:hypothetical protein